MIVTCPSCSARFAVKAEAIGATGRKVRCAKCKHDWFQEPVAAEILTAVAAIPEPPAVEIPIPEGANLPAKVESSTNILLKVAFAASVILCAFAMSILFSNKILPHMGWYYGAMGVYDDKGIAIYNISAEKIGEGEKKELLVKGRIVNEAKEGKVIPNMRIVLVGPGGKQLRKIMLDSHNAALAPGDGVDFENRITNVPQDAENLVVDIGNPINLAAR